MHIVRQTKEDLFRALENREVVLFGAGNVLMRFLNTIDISEKVKFICDNNKRKIGSKLYGIDIVSADALRAVTPKDAVVVITTERFQQEIENQVSDYGNFDIYFATTILTEYYERISATLYDKQDVIEEVSKMLIDDTSRMVYREVIRRRMLYGNCDFSDLKIAGDKVYILPQMYAENRPHDEIIVDCGAYTGDSMNRFINTFCNKVKKIYAFECGKAQLEILRQNVGLLSKREGSFSPEIEIMPYAVSDVNETTGFCQREKLGGSFVVRNNEMRSVEGDVDEYAVQMVTLDTVLPENEMITLIKMDVEGSEYSALQGASRTILRCKPKLEISIYHLAEDYFRLALYIKELVPEYKLAVRHHNNKYFDTVLYAWI